VFALFGQTHRFAPAIPHASEKFAADGTPTDENVVRRLEEMGRQVTRFSYLHASQTAREFLAAWETAMENPGGE